MRGAILTILVLLVVGLLGVLGYQLWTRYQDTEKLKKDKGQAQDRKARKDKTDAVTDEKTGERRKATQKRDTTWPNIWAL